MIRPAGSSRANDGSAGSKRRWSLGAVASRANLLSYRSPAPQKAIYGFPGWDLDSEVLDLHDIDFFVVASLNIAGELTKPALAGMLHHL